jgi:hypothetical protein
MYQAEDLKEHLQKSNTIRSQSVVLAEWNMNFSENIKLVGNYRNRPLSADSIYVSAPNSFDINDAGGFYTGATDADVVIDGVYIGSSDPNSEQVPAPFLAPKQKEKLLFSLDECFGRFRPRSGINKIRLGVNNNHVHSANKFMADRPRYYLADKSDKFKYWTSYRTEYGNEYGIAINQRNGQYYIDDAAPFVVYSEPVPANRIVVKMQTNVGSIDLGPFSTDSGTVSDVLYGYENQTTPTSWKVQYLDKNNSWVDATSFTSTSKRKDGSPIIGSDGYVELSYGLRIPDEFISVFRHVATVSDLLDIIELDRVGDAYLYKQNDSDAGTFYVWDGKYFRSFAASYEWQLIDYEITSYENITADIIKSETFVSANGEIMFRDIQYIYGLRIVVDTMNILNSTFDLIELSPRLVADISDHVDSLSIQKTASDLGVTGMPVGQLLASVGSINIFDTENAFNLTNSNSLIAKYITKNLEISIYDAYFGIGNIDYYVPIKKMYADGFPSSDKQSRVISMNLRDKFFIFESMMAPQMLLTNVSLSYAISVLLDNVGFSNYSFRRVANEPDPIIQYFYIPPDKTVAEILNELALSTQSAMYFDEYNNLIVASKEYMIPSSGQRNTSITLYGSPHEGGNLENIISLAKQDMPVYNDGQINYTVNYIQKSYSTIRQSLMLDKDKTWIYKPVLLWEVPSEESTKAINESVSTQSGYVLSAIPLNSDLSSSIPVVENRQIVNNSMDLGEAVYWLSRYNGYFYANAEIIRYDAVEYSVPMTVVGTNRVSNSNVWISSVQEYQEYFSMLPFNGKIYPTGRVRIFAEPNYEVVNGETVLMDGPVAKHGRGQFGTDIAYHSAGISSYWTNTIAGTISDPFSKASMDAAQAAGYSTFTVPVTRSSTGTSGVTDVVAVNSLASNSYRSGMIKNFLSSSYQTESETSTQLQASNIQASALVFNGPSIPTDISAKNHVSYIYKPLDSYETKMTSFGTRMRVIGRVESGSSNSQSPSGSVSYYTVPSNSPDQSASISGGSGGLGILINPQYGTGYYLEIAALSDTNISDYDTSNLYNIAFYKTSASGTGNNVSFNTTYLWNGLSNILVDDGRFTGQARVIAEDYTTVYDLAVEYEDFASYRRFYIYLNNTQIATVDDTSPLQAYQGMALFVRGSSRCMFENVYAISNNYSVNQSTKVDAPINTAFGTSSISYGEAIRKYAISGMVQSTYLSGINTSGSQYKMYYEEFGTIMREASYFNIKYDKAYPALYAQISPTFNKIRGYVISGFRGNPYGAEFLVFNATDTQLVLDETSGNYLRIQGITFTQSGTKALTVDEYFGKTGDTTDPTYSSDGLIISPLVQQKLYNDIKNSRISYGTNSFSLDATYLQSYGDANNLMGWLMQKVSKTRMAVGVQIAPNSMIQLGDIVQIKYLDENGNNEMISEDKQFVVYAISYDKNVSDTSMTVFLSEVV